MKEEIEKYRTDGQVVKVICPSCAVTTNHVVLTSVSQCSESKLSETYSVYLDRDFEVIKCQGCDDISFRINSFFSEDIEPDGTPIYRETLYPNRNANTITLKDFKNLPDKIEAIYEEVINCYNSKSFILCAAGIRSVVEGVCFDKKVVSGHVKEKDGKVNLKRDLQGKINGLHEKGVLTSNHAEILHQHRFLGNTAVHELKRPSTKDLKIAIEIIEHMFDTLYEIPSKGYFLKESIERKSKN